MPDIPGITDFLMLGIICATIAVVILVLWYRSRKKLRTQEGIESETPEEIFRMVSRVKYPQYTDSHSAQKPALGTVLKPDTAQQPAEIELTRDRKDITESFRALVEKYNLAEITLATDDGLVFATSSGNDVQFDAVKYSQIARHRALPDEPDVTLFELVHRESHFTGIIRTSHKLPRNWKDQIRDDTKVILKWWL
jgi:hypothetical protein